MATPERELDAAIVARSLTGAQPATIARELKTGIRRVRRVLAAYADRSAVLDARASLRKSARAERLRVMVLNDPARSLTWRDLASQLGSSPEDVQEAIGPLESARRHPIKASAAFALEPVLADMHRVWLANGRVPLTTHTFTAQRHPSMVVANSVIRRVGSWTEACRLAQVTAPPSDAPFQPRTTQDILAWVALFLTETTGVHPARYTRWASSEPRAPRQHVVVARIGTWGDAMRAAVATIDDGTWRDPRPQATARPAASASPGSAPDAPFAERGHSQ